MYVSRPDYYLKGGESAGLVRQKANRARGSRRETNLRRVHMESGGSWWKSAHFRDVCKKKKKEKKAGI